MDRDDLLLILADTIRTLKRSIDGDDPVSAADEELRLKRMRTLASLAAEYRRLQSETSLDDIAEELDVLKEGLDEEV